MRRNRQFAVLVVSLVAVSLLATAPRAGAQEARSTGQSVYLPLYSHVYFGDRHREFNLTSTAYVRNPDTQQTITLTTVDYYSHKGIRLRGLIDEPLTVAPLSTRSFTIKESDTSGGSGASILVRWRSDHPANPPLVESVMIGAASTQGISFVCQGRVIDETAP